MNPAFTINPSRDAIERALESWQWLPVAGRETILVSAFGDMFFEGADGIWFLDTLEGTFQRICATRGELQVLLATPEAESRYFLAGYVERGSREGMTLKDGQCYDFTLHPAVGGKIEYSNIQPVGRSL
jgi:hypothetical protein